MNSLFYFLVMALLIMVCVLIHELGKTKDDVADLEYEVTQQKLEYRREIKALKNQLNFIRFCREAGNAKIDKAEGKFSEQEFNTWAAEQNGSES